MTSERVLDAKRDELLIAQTVRVEPPADDPYPAVPTGPSSVAANAPPGTLVIQAPAPVMAPPAKPVKGVSAQAAADLRSKGGAAFVDVRPANAFVFGHVPGSVNLPAERAAGLIDAQAAGWPKDRPIVVYGQTGRATDADAVAVEFMNRGWTGVVRLADGWNGWAKAGLPRERGYQPAR